MASGEAAPPVELVYACLTHGPRLVDFPPFVSTIRLGTAQQDDGGLNLRDLAPEWEPHHPILGGNAGAFALKNWVLTQHPGATHVGICQYRKFVSNCRLSTRIAPSYPSMDMVPAALLTPSVFSESMQKPLGLDFLVTHPAPLSDRQANPYDTLEQYGRAHLVQDLLRFTAEAVEQRVLDQFEAELFFREDWLVPGGIEMGIYPVRFWLDAITALENITRACVDRYPTPRDGYNARAWAFCSERLGSYLLMRHLRAVDSGKPAPRIGHWGDPPGPPRRRAEPVGDTLWKRMKRDVRAWRRHVAKRHPGIDAPRHTGALNLILDGDSKDYVVGT